MEAIKITKIELSPKPFESMRWVAKAAAKEETRYAIDGINITEKYIMATDGQRLHVIKNETKHPLGLYSIEICNKTKILLTKKAEGLRFPSVDELLLPELKEQPPIIIDSGKTCTVEEWLTHFAIYQQQCDGDDIHSVSIEFVKEFLGMNIHQTTKLNDPILLSSPCGLRWAAVMPT